MWYTRRWYLIRHGKSFQLKHRKNFKLRLTYLLFAHLATISQEIFYKNDTLKCSTHVIFTLLSNRCDCSLNHERNIRKKIEQYAIYIHIKLWLSLWLHNCILFLRWEMWNSVNLWHLAFLWASLHAIVSFPLLKSCKLTGCK